MNYLIDTHVFIWWIQNSRFLSGKVKKIITDLENEIYFSVVSVWEISIKTQIGKLSIEGYSKELLKNEVIKNNLEVLQIGFDHAWQLNNLPLLHKDPFDRMLIAQAQIEKIPIISQDKQLKKYDVEIIW